MGFLKSLVRGFTGEEAKDQITQGRAAANSEITRGEQGSLDEYGRAITRLDPYESGGREGYDAYRASIGLMGPEEQARIQGMYFDDPVQNALMDRVTRANTRAFTAGGMSNSGAATQSLTNRLLDTYRGWQDRLMNLGAGGQQAATGQATIQTGMGDTRFAAAQQRAGVHTGAANALAANAGTGMNNLMGLVGMGLKAFGSFGAGGK